ncbi:MAG: amidohydrolase family protein [Acidobacteriia bacterium]|nr:amidohydrolase family protein [Terriglobia bacterium]
MLNRRQFTASLIAASSASAQKAPPIIDTHIHLFAADQKRFPYHPQGTYKPPAAPLEPYLDFVQKAGIHHVILVHPEPYQDDHSYLEHCFANEKPRGLFKGTCLFDATDPRTPDRMRALVKQHPGRIVGLRIHAMNPPGQASLASGPIKNRDLAHPQMRKAWAAASDLGLAIQMHFLPHHAPAIARLASQFRDTTVILDHMGRAGQGTPADLDPLLKLSAYPKVYFKFSGVGYSSKQKFPFTDAKPIVRAAFDEFGAARILWGGLGHSMPEFQQASKLLDLMFDYASPRDREHIRGRNAAQLFHFD